MIESYDPSYVLIYSNGGSGKSSTRGINFPVPQVRIQNGNKNLMEHGTYKESQVLDGEPGALTTEGCDFENQTMDTFLMADGSQLNHMVSSVDLQDPRSTLHLIILKVLQSKGEACFIRSTVVLQFFGLIFLKIQDGVTRSISEKSNWKNNLLKRFVGIK